MESLIINLIVWCFIAGVLIRIIPDKVKFVKEAIALITTFILFISGIFLFGKRGYVPGGWFIYDNLSMIAFLGITIFGLIITIYSLSYMKNREFKNKYYAYILWTLSCGTGAVFSNHLILFAVFWGFLGATLYLLVNLGGEDASLPAKKTFIIVGGTDSFLLLGIGILWALTGTFFIDEIHIMLKTGIAFAAFFCLLSASLAKAGAMPFHTWIPEISETAPVSVLAFLPASLDKLLGIYFLARICLNLFNFHYGMWFLLRFIGAFTIVAAVMMALVQHNVKKLLSYHAVSQVGYMVLGIGSGNPIGIIGGLFHMINNAIYKCALFLGIGAVEEKAKTTELKNLGGIGKLMPITFSAFLISSLAISGVPPLNGFFSKWMIYQGLFEGAKSDPNFSWALWIIAAMIGSALTLASFLKVIHSVFLGKKKEYKEEIKEVSFSMVFPPVMLSILCIIIGFGYRGFVSRFLFRIIPGSYNFTILGSSTILILIALLIGLISFAIVSSIKVRIVPNFIGGEEVKEEMDMSGTEFYRTIEEMGFFKKVYELAKNKIFDIYEIGKGIVFYFGKIFRYLHSGVLLTYLSWIMFGLIVLLFIFMKM